MRCRRRKRPWPYEPAVLRRGHPAFRQKHPGDRCAPLPFFVQWSRATAPSRDRRAGRHDQSRRTGALTPRRGPGGAGHAGQVPEDKTCASCGRRIAWRPKWADSWDDVRYCSDACRRRRLTSVDVRLEQLLGALVAQAGRAGVDPDDAARCVDPAGWKALHEPARRAARRLVAAGVAELVQAGRVVDPSTARGDVRVRSL